MIMFGSEWTWQSGYCRTWTDWVILAIGLMVLFVGVKLVERLFS